MFAKRRAQENGGRKNGGDELKPRRAKSHDAIKPLIELCRTGHLAEVQKWLADGGPVEGPQFSGKGNRRHTPLQYAIQAGFYDLVEVLLKQGAEMECSGRYSAMNHALSLRRFDLVKLLVSHGVNPREVNMGSVFSTWDPAIMVYFIEQGADVESGNPLAEALCGHVRTALGILRKYRDRFPSFKKQADMALRYHCNEGNLKWVSLMLWAGADPYAPGRTEYWEDHSEDAWPGWSALVYAARSGHFEVFQCKGIHIDFANPELVEVLKNISGDAGMELMGRWLAAGFNPNDQKNGGSSVLDAYLRDLSWDTYAFFHRENPRSLLDTAKTREKLKAVHLLAKHGAKWIPEERWNIGVTRRALLKMTPDYALEVAWIMSLYGSCTRATADILFKTSSMQRHLANEGGTLRQYLAKLPEELPAQKS